MDKQDLLFVFLLEIPAFACMPQTPSRSLQEDKDDKEEEETDRNDSAHRPCLFSMMNGREGDGERAAVEGYGCETTWESAHVSINYAQDV